MNPAYDLVTVARDVVRAFASDPSIRAALRLNTATEVIPVGDPDYSLFLAGEMAAAQEAQACLAALGGIESTNANDLRESAGVGTIRQRNVKNIDSEESRRNFLAYRSTIVLLEPPLSITFPHSNGPRIAGDLVMVSISPYL